MVARIVQHDDHAPAARSLTKQLLEEMPEGFGIEHLAHLAYKLTRAQVDRAKTSDGLAGRCMLQDRVLDLRKSGN